jgi:hypothetical protein
MRDCALLPTLITFMGITPGMMDCKYVEVTRVQICTASCEAKDNRDWRALKDSNKKWRSLFVEVEESKVTEKRQRKA